MGDSWLNRDNVHYRNKCYNTTSTMSVPVIRMRNTAEPLLTSCIPDLEEQLPCSILTVNKFIQGVFWYTGQSTYIIHCVQVLLYLQEKKDNLGTLNSFFTSFCWKQRCIKCSAPFGKLLFPIVPASNCLEWTWTLTF